jgi:integrase
VLPKREQARLRGCSQRREDRDPSPFNPSHDGPASLADGHDEPGVTHESHVIRQGWLPPRNDAKEKSYLFPVEEAAFHSNQRVPLVRRLLVGLCAREGLRKENAVTLKWCDLTFQSNGEVMISLDTTKNGRGGAWVLDPATAEALRRWHTICPSETFVFPASALPQHRDTDDRPMYVDHLADQLRDGLQKAGVKREKLFERGANRIRLRAHDLRATFVTLALANGRTEDWVSTRTGHGSSQMIALYRRQAKTAVELRLGWLKPLHEIIPELAGLGAQKRGRGRR